MSLLSAGFGLARPVLHAMDAEQAHRLTIRMLSCLPRRPLPAAGPLQQELFGLRFPNPLGLAPGFDKNAEVPDAMLSLGFGFVEIGTVTPRPQSGNPLPRLFRLSDDRAVINRMGFNNDGADRVMQRLEARRGNPGIVGINIGANKDSADRIADYAEGVRRFGPLASYLTINISSPNTPGLRGLQSREELQRLLAAVNEARASLARRPPMLLKIAPDLGDDELQDIAACCSGGTVDGVIVSNTTLSRPELKSSHRGEAGGLSGAPLFALSTRQLAKFYQMTGGRLPLIGVGGVHDVDTALAKLEAGAQLIQLYSALVYEGPSLVASIAAGLAQRLAGRSLTDVIGSRAGEIAEGKPILNRRG